MKKICGVVAIMMLSFIFLVGCGTSRKSEKEVRKELEEYINTSDNQQNKITEFEVIKRQKNDTKDRIFVKVRIENKEVECIIGYGMEYGLYDEGWILDRVWENSDIEKYYIPKKGPEQEYAAKEVPEEYSFLEKQEDLEKGYCSYFFDKTKNEALADTYIKYQIDYKFDNKIGKWILQDIKLENERNWKIEGLWKAVRMEKKNPYDPWGTKYEVKYELAITDVTSDKCHVRIYTNGVLSRELDVNLKNGYSSFSTEDNMTSPTIHLDCEKIFFQELITTKDDDIYFERYEVN